MFAALSLLALVAPFVNALTLHTPANVMSAAQITIEWDWQPTDPPFSLQLQNTVFHDTFAIANNVQPGQSSLTVTLPVVPAPRDGYVLQAFNIGNVNDVYSQTAPFNIALNPSASSVSSVSSTTSGTVTGTSTGSVTSATTPVVTTRSATSSGFGTTVQGSNTASSTSRSTGTGTAAANSPSTSSAAMAPLKINSNVGAFAAVVFSAIAGAAIVVF